VEEPIVETLSTGRTYDFGTEKFPSITTVLSKTADKSHLEAWRERIGKEEADKISKHASSTGSELHNLLEAWIKNDELPEVSATTKMLFRAVAPVVARQLSHVIAIELPLQSTSIRVAGRTDLIGIWDGTPVVLDWKSNHGNGPKNLAWVTDYRIQEAFYAKAFEETFGKKIKTGVLVFANVLGVQVDKFDLFPYNQLLLERVNSFYGERSEVPA
jgi:genome maintenance exonuclease 1